MPPVACATRRHRTVHAAHNAALPACANRGSEARPANASTPPPNHYRRPGCADSEMHRPASRASRKERHMRHPVALVAYSYGIRALVRFCRAACIAHWGRRFSNPCYWHSWQPSLGACPAQPRFFR